MSRTDKDVPAKLRGRYHPHRRVVHDWLCEDHAYGYAPRNGLTVPCDMDVAPDRIARCGYDIPHHELYPIPASREDRHVYYYGPERAAVRDSLTRAVREYNATGDTEPDPPTRQAKGSRWSGGWWD